LFLNIFTLRNKNTEIIKSNKEMTVKTAEGDTKVKRPTSSFFLFMNDRRSKFKEDNPDLALGQITKGLTEVWKALKEDEKKKYDDMAKADKERYVSELEA
jgi:upstream-binding transcription factor